MKTIFKYFFLFLMIVGVAKQSHCQQNKIDSLEILLNTAEEDTNKVILLYNLASYRDSNWSVYCDSAVSISRKIKFMRGLAKVLELQARCYLNMRSDFLHAIQKWVEASKAFESINDSIGIAQCYHGMGLFYSNLKDYDKSIKYLKQAETINKRKNNFIELSRNYGMISLVYDYKNNNDSAFYYSYKAIEIKKIIEKSPVVNYINMAELFIKTNQFDSAISYIIMADSCYYVMNNYDYGHSWTNAVKGKLYIKQKNYKGALPLLLFALKYARDNKDGELLQEIIEPIKVSYGELKDYKNFFYFQTISDSLKNVQKVQEASIFQANYEIEQQEKIRQLEGAKKESEHQAEVKQQKIIIGSVVGGLLLVFVFSLFLGNRYRITQKQKKVIEEQKLLVEEKNKIVEEKNKDITDSINYAKRIQEAILPDKEIKYRIFSDAFVLFQPKDVVSGDFYWFAEKNGKRLISAVDCTGHGVPGAFMSMIGNAFLNEIVNQRGITQPSEILSELRHSIIHSLKQSDKEGGAKDGMDIALLSFDDKNNIVEFSGAHNPMLMCRKEDGSYKMEEYLADKRPIGYYLGKGLSFTNQKINFRKGDTLYIFTDGYADQFGGMKGKKFKYKQFQQVLLSIQNESMSKQEEILLKTFNDWKGSLEQIDDVLVIGVRV